MIIIQARIKKMTKILETALKLAGWPNNQN